MKSGMMMLAFLLAATTAETREESVRAMIHVAEGEQEEAHASLLRSLPEAEEITFYNTEWLRLRQRKQWSIAEAEIRLKPASPRQETRILAIR